MRKIALLLMFTLLFVAACSDKQTSTNNELSENAQSFSPHAASYEYFVDFYNEVQNALNEELDLSDIYERFDELEAEKREVQEGLVDVTNDELAEAAGVLSGIADDRETTLDDEGAVFDEIESQLDDAQETLESVMSRGYSTQGDELMEIATERLEAQRAILDGKFEIISRERALYDLFSDADSTQEEINAQTKAISEAYVEVSELSETLGTHTEQLNEVLESLYEFMN